MGGLPGGWLAGHDKRGLRVMTSGPGLVIRARFLLGSDMGISGIAVWAPPFFQLGLQTDFQKCV